MLRILIPLVLGLTGLGAGVGAGIALRHNPAEAPPEDAGPCGELPAEEPELDPALDPDVPDPTSEFVDLENQFVIPVVEQGRVGALVVMKLSIETIANGTERVYQREPKLRDRFLRVLLDHANTGGFDGDFTSNGSMDRLRRALLETARLELPETVRDVLILDIARQDTT